jgi:hypothetical protein
VGLELEELHNRAMALADQADAARRRRKPVRAAELLKEALAREREAALRLHALPAAPPATVAILLQSAASPAFESGDAHEAERLIARALSGDPPPSLVLYNNPWEP